ncbi:MAG: phosphotransferase [Fusicatenibacter sp.]|nr:phosphotransferase [Fusicatenibacter sp.]
MYDYGLSVLPRYALTCSSSARVRGALLCDTDKGLKIISEFGGANAKLEQQYLFQQQITASGILRCDQVLRNEEGELVTVGEDGIPYIVREWCPGRECDTRNKDEIIRAARALARLHTIIHLPVKEEYVKESLVQECTRHNAEIRKIRKYLLKKKKRNEFETLLLSCAEPYLAQGEEMVEHLCRSSYEQLRVQAITRGSICHGEYNQHNILLDGVKAEMIVNFEKWDFDLPTADLYHFMRKILEKHNWDRHTADLLLNAYNAVRPLGVEELQDLKLRISYPWKYWKIANHYYGSSKAWISSKNTEKLRQLNAQKEDWINFIKNVDF